MQEQYSYQHSKVRNQKCKSTTQCAVILCFVVSLSSAHFLGVVPQVGVAEHKLHAILLEGSDGDLGPAAVVQIHDAESVFFGWERKLCDGEDQMSMLNTGPQIAKKIVTESAVTVDATARGSCMPLRGGSRTRDGSESRDDQPKIKWDFWLLAAAMDMALNPNVYIFTQSIGHWAGIVYPR